MKLISKFNIRNFLQILGIGILSLLPSVVLAKKPPPPPGRIVFLGETNDGSRSVWLSVTGDGTFEVEAKNQIVDEWTQTNPGLHVTLSPNLNNPHSLFKVVDGQMVFIDKDNQQGGITFPPLPGGNPPGEVTPPIYTPPPIISHPIVLPGVPTHPIAKPPGVPTHPIVKPGVPTHPIVKPGVPTHPIVLPGVPTHPIVIPPEGGTPPGGGIPPSGGTPPGGTTPPSEGVPSTPGPTTPSPSGIPNNERGTRQIYLPSKPNEPSNLKEPTREKTSEEMTPKIIIPPEIALPSKRDGYSAGDQSAANLRNNGFTNEAPLTKGRRFAQEPCVNVWADGRYFYIKDFRYGLDREGYATNFTIGADRRITNDLVLGAMLAFNTGKSLSFNNNWLTNARGFTAGPYFGYRLLPNWSVEGTLGIGRLENHNNILILNGKFNSTVYCASLQGIGVYNVCDIQLQVKPAIYYSYFHNSGYNLSGTLNGNFFTVPVSNFTFPYGLAQFGVEAGKTFTFANDQITTVPYIELGLNYAFARPNNGQILTGNLTMQNTNPLCGYARVGIRTLITRSFFVETTASYLTIGANNLDIWQARLFLSWAFY